MCAEVGVSYVFENVVLFILHLNSIASLLCVSYPRLPTFKPLEECVRVTTGGCTAPFLVGSFSASQQTLTTRPLGHSSHASCAVGKREP